MSTKPNTPSTNTTAKEPRDLRLRNKYFPDAATQVFDTKKSGFVPMPIIMRKLMRHLSAAELRVLVYLQTRSSRNFICYPTLEEIAHDLGMAGRRNLTPHIKALRKRNSSPQLGAVEKHSSLFLILELPSRIWWKLAR